MPSLEVLFCLSRLSGPGEVHLDNCAQSWFPERGGRITRIEFQKRSNNLGGGQFRGSKYFACELRVELLSPTPHQQSRASEVR
jgi:hypothetical protein